MMERCVWALALLLAVCLLGGRTACLNLELQQARCEAPYVIERLPSDIDPHAAPVKDWTAEHPASPRGPVVAPR